MKKQLYKNLIHGAIILFLFTGIANAQAPGGVSTSASTTYGIAYTLYNGAANVAALSAQTYGTLLATGYVNSMNDIDDKILAQKVYQNYTLVGKATLTIVNTGSYSFTMNGIDDYGVILVDGNIVYTGTYGGTVTITPIPNLSAGTHSIEIRYSNAGGSSSNPGSGSQCEPWWKGNTTGLDAGTSFAYIPDSKFTITAKISNWYKADAGVTPNTDQATITAWSDQSGNTNPTNLIAANSPLYQLTNVTNQFNFNPSISLYNSSDRKFRSAAYANNLAWGAQGQTMIAVSSLYSIATGTGYNQFLISYGQDNGNKTEAQMLLDGNILLRNGVGGTGGFNQATSATAPFTVANQQGISTGTMQNYAFGSTNNLNQYFNGASSATGSDNSSSKNLNANFDFWVGEEANQANGGYN
ncbi:MAG: hypothetical protein JST96_10915, partial [Bacteroidetes bacterium]|nr:hypothetical protein [Bacteroidota bacterium]